MKQIYDFEQHTHPVEAAEFLAEEILKNLLPGRSNELEKKSNDAHIIESSDSAR